MRSPRSTLSPILANVSILTSLPESVFEKLDSASDHLFGHSGRLPAKAFSPHHLQIFVDPKEMGHLRQEMLGYVADVVIVVEEGIGGGHGQASMTQPGKVGWLVITRMSNESPSSQKVLGISP
jgi:hypothetical protein